MKQPVPVDFKGHNFFGINENGNLTFSQQIMDDVGSGNLPLVNMLSYSYTLGSTVVDESIDVKTITSESVIDRRSTFVSLPIAFPAKVTDSGSLLPAATNKIVVVGRALIPNVGDT